MKPRWQLRARVCNNTVAKHPTEGRPAASPTLGSCSPNYQVCLGSPPPYPQNQVSVDASIMYSHSLTVKPVYRFASAQIWAHFSPSRP